MANDALDPGPSNTFPFFPRWSDGTPAWGDSSKTDGQKSDRGQALMPRGIRHIRRDDERIAVDVTPRGPDGTPSTRSRCCHESRTGSPA